MKKKALSQDFMQMAEQACFARLIKSEFWQQSESIFTYVSYKEEMGTHLLIKKAFEEGKKVAAPRVEGDIMEFYYFSSMDELKKNKMGILEPVPSALLPQDLDDAGCNKTNMEHDTSYNDRDIKNITNLGVDENALFIMPGVAFDLSHNRIGYGGGYYDKYLIAHPHRNKIALAYDFQIFEEIPAEKHDIKPDMIMTENRVI